MLEYIFNRTGFVLKSPHYTLGSQGLVLLNQTWCMKAWSRDYSAPQIPQICNLQEQNNKLCSIWEGWVTISIFNSLIISCILNHNAVIGRFFALILGLNLGVVLEKKQKVIFSCNQISNTTLLQLLDLGNKKD